MPKITGASVPEHRAAQYEALLSTAERLIDERGGAVPSLQEVAQEMGLARSSLYQYVSSRTDMVVQLLLRIIPRWTDAVVARMDAAGARPSDRLAAYVEGMFELFAFGSHGPLMAASKNVPEAFADPRVSQVHGALEPVLHRCLASAGCPAPEVTGPLLDAAIHRGAERVLRGEADATITLAALQRLVAGLRADTAVG